MGQLVSVKYRRCESLVAGACPDLDSWSRDHIPHIMSPALPWSQPPGHRCQVQTWSQSGHIQGGTRIKAFLAEITKILRDLAIKNSKVKYEFPSYFPLKILDP